MDLFLKKHSKSILGALSGFDRIIFKSYLQRLLFAGGMKYHLDSSKILLKDFKAHAFSTSNAIITRTSSAAYSYQPSAFSF